MSTYVTTAISYVNGAPHLGHALELVYADAIARARRARGETVRFVTGTDENGLKNVRAAEEEGIAVRALVDRNAARFASLAKKLDISHDDFIRTTEPRHIETVERVYRACETSGDFYRAPYRGLYCVGCEAFVDGPCDEHAAAPELVEEDNIYFRLSRHAASVRALIESERLRIHPLKAKNELLAFLDRGLNDFSASRSHARARGWGIPIPRDPSQVFYVWFDALVNYVSARGWDAWSLDQERIHVVGKGITRFHAVHWPAILLSAGLAPPTSLVVHGYLTAGGKKIGKSLGNAIDPLALIENYGVEAVRYALLRINPTEDADFSEARLRTLRDTELADQLGNLVQRTVRLIERATGGAVPHGEPLRFLPSAADLRPDLALAEIFALVEDANRFVEAKAPWKAPLEDQRSTLATLAATIAHAASALEPYLPSTSRAIKERIGVHTSRVAPGPPLFPKTR